MDTPTPTNTQPILDLFGVPAAPGRLTLGPVVPANYYGAENKENRPPSSPSSPPPRPRSRQPPPREHHRFADINTGLRPVNTNSLVPRPAERRVLLDYRTELRRRQIGLRRDDPELRRLRGDEFFHDLHVRQRNRIQSFRRSHLHPIDDPEEELVYPMPELEPATAPEPAEEEAGESGADSDIIEFFDELFGAGGSEDDEPDDDDQDHDEESSDDSDEDTEMGEGGGEEEEDDQPESQELRDFWVQRARIIFGELDEEEHSVAAAIAATAAIGIAEAVAGPSTPTQQQQQQQLGLQPGRRRATPRHGFRETLALGRHLYGRDAIHGRTSASTWTHTPTPPRRITFGDMALFR